MAIKIYYLYSTLKTLEPISGDRINEINFIKSLSEFAEVHYNGSLSEEYDMAIVRANKKVFEQLKCKKIWVSSPYDKNCFKSADRIFTFTRAWAEMLNAGIKYPALNPDGFTWNNAVPMYQCIGVHFKPGKKKRFVDADIVLGYFGRLAKCTWPYLLFRNWQRINDAVKDFKFVMFTGSDKVPRLNNVINAHVEHKDVPAYIRGCDAVIVPQTGPEWQVCGNIKIKEAAGCGVPVICERSAARIEELGREYDLFLPSRAFVRGRDNIKYADMIIEYLLRIKQDKEFRNNVSENLLKRMEFYRIKNHSKYIKEVVDGI